MQCNRIGEKRKISNVTLVMRCNHSRKSQNFTCMIEPQFRAVAYAAVLLLSKDNDRAWKLQRETTPSECVLNDKLGDNIWFDIL